MIGNETNHDALIKLYLEKKTNQQDSIYMESIEVALQMALHSRMIQKKYSVKHLKGLDLIACDSCVFHSLWKDEEKNRQ